MKKTTLASLVVALAATVVHGADEKITIKVRYTPGTYVVTQKMETQSEITALGGAPEKQDMNRQSAVEMKAEAPQPDGHQRITVTYKQARRVLRVKYSTDGRGGSEIYDSAHPDDKSRLFGKADRDRLGVPFEVLVDEDGNVIKITRMAKIGEATAKEPPATADNVDRLKKLAEDETIKIMFDFLKPLTPGTSVAMRDTWTNTLSIRKPLIGERDIKIHCKLEEIRQTPTGKLAVIAFEGKGSRKKAKPPEGAPAAFALADLIRSWDTELSGKQTVCVDTGLVVALDMDRTEKIDMLAIEADDPERKGVQTTSKSKTTVRITPGAYEPEPGSEPVTEEPTTQEPAADK